MAERVKGRRVIEYQYDDLGLLVKEVETSFEPLDGGSSEFVGDDLTQSLDHGDVPLEGGNWRIFKIYEKKVIWIRRGEESKP